MTKKKHQRPKISDMFEPKKERFRKNRALSEKMFYDMKIETDLMPGHSVLSLYFAGADFCCDPRRISLPEHEPKYSLYDSMKKHAHLKQGFERMKIGVCLVGSNPALAWNLWGVFYLSHCSIFSIYTDGSNVTSGNWPKYVSNANILIKHSREVEYLPTYYESMVEPLDALQGIKNRRFIARYTKETKDEILETANIFQDMKKGWEIVEYDCDKQEWIC